MRLLDLFCGAGGAAMGYSRAGFTEIVGVDNRPQKHYPFTFVLADALEYVAEHGREFDAIHASPPCQGYSLGVRNGTKRLTPRLIDETRIHLIESGKPYVIENVRGASRFLKITPQGYFVLCGTMFSNNVPVRHRLFEVWPFMWAPPHPKCRNTNKRLAASLGVDRRMVEVATVHECVSLWKSLMGMSWCDDPLGLTEAIPPAYTEFIGKQLIKHTLH